MRDTTKPARCSSEAAWSYGRPTTFGTFTGRGPFDTLTRTCVPSTTTVPALGDCAVTVPSSRSELTSTTCAISPERVISATASATDWPTTLGIATSGLPEETSMRTTSPSSTRVPSVGVWEKTTPSSTSELDTGRTFGMSPASSICWTARACGMPTTYGTATVSLPWN